MQSLSPEAEKNSPPSKLKALMVAPSSIIYGFIPGYDILSTETLVGALYWLYKNERPIDEVWLHTETDIGKGYGVSIPHFLRDGVDFCEILQIFPVPDLKKIRLLSKNPVHNKAIIRMMENPKKGKVYEVCFNAPRNQRVWR